VYLKLLGKKF